MIKSLLYYHLDHPRNIVTNLLMYSNNSRYIQLNYISALQHLNLLDYLFEYCLFLLMQSVNGAQFLNITPLFCLSNRFALSSSPALSFFTFPLTNTHA